jgi:molybdopterin/thiamine biosynthesis adenylyltransferase
MAAARISHSVAGCGGYFFLLLRHKDGNKGGSIRCFIECDSVNRCSLLVQVGLSYNGVGMAYGATKKWMEVRRPWLPRSARLRCGGGNRSGGKLTPDSFDGEFGATRPLVKIEPCLFP